MNDGKACAAGARVDTARSWCPATPSGPATSTPTAYPAAYASGWVAVHVLPSAASVPATGAPLALLVTVTLVARPCATCTTIGVSGFTPWVPGLIDTTGRTGAAVVGGAGRKPGAPGAEGAPVATARPPQRVRSTSTPSAAGILRGRQAVPSVRSRSIRSGVSDPPILTHATGRRDRRARPWEVCPDRPRGRAGRFGVVGWRGARHVTDEPAEPPGRPVR